MSDLADPLDLACRLIACRSVTPADGGALTVLGDALAAIGFSVERFASGGPPDGPVQNLLATRGTGGPHLAFAGHSDVVPPGDGWASDPFAPTIRGDLLHGRGAVDMKGALAAMVAAAARVRDHAGTLSFVVTGDEEGPATHGTVALIERMRERGLVPDLCLVGEPTSDLAFGDTIKIGRRGSVNLWIEVPGTQGHVAYPHLADNPATRLVAALAELSAWQIDAGTDWFQRSNLEITDIHVGNPATNIIPGSARARVNIRFCDLQRGAALADHVRAVVLRYAPRAAVEAKISGEAFLTPPGTLSALVADAVRAVTGMEPALSTSGGTSDARFLVALCPVVEFGLVNATMHKLDEAVAIPDLRACADVYEGVIRRALG